jgi:hypothetical protein
MSKELDNQRRKMRLDQEAYDRLMELAAVPIGGRIRGGNGLQWERVDDDEWVPRHNGVEVQGVNEEELPLETVLERVAKQYSPGHSWPSTHFTEFTILEEADGKWRPVKPGTVVFRVRIDRSKAFRLMDLVDELGSAAQYRMEGNGE